MSHQRRVEGVEHGAGPRQNRRRRQERADDGDPESCPRPGVAGDPAERGIGHEIAQRHDEERREDQCQEHAVCRHRQVVDAGRAERQLDAGASERLHHCHHRPHGEGGHRDPEVGQHQPRRRGHRAALHDDRSLHQVVGESAVLVADDQVLAGSLERRRGLTDVARRHRQVHVRADDLEPVQDIWAGDAKGDRPSCRDANDGRPKHVQLGAHRDRDPPVGPGHDSGRRELTGHADRRGIDGFDVARRMNGPGERRGDDGSREENQHAGCGPHPIALVALDVHRSAFCLVPSALCLLPSTACSAE